MSAERTARRLLRCYPARWRARYGEELAALIVDMSGEQRVPWRLRADVARGAAGERLQALGLGGTDPSTRASGGTLAVMWAWALFILAGVVVAKTSEHWQQALPGSHIVATAAFVLLIAGAVLAGALVLLGLALALPGFVADLQSGGWARVRGRIVAAAVLTVVLIAATAALSAWAHGITFAARNGHDTSYTIAFVIWAVLGAATLLTWTAAADRAARRLALARATVRAQVWLATGVAAAMAVMTAATIVWYALVASDSAAALTGGATMQPASALVTRLLAAIVLMLAATALAGAGARRAVTALPELIER